MNSAIAHNIRKSLSRGYYARISYLKDSYNNWRISREEYDKLVNQAQNLYAQNLAQLNESVES